MRHLFLILIIGLCSCKKEVRSLSNNLTAITASTASVASVDTPHLYIPELELGYYAPNYNGGEGLTSAGLWSYVKYATVRNQTVYQNLSDAYFGKIPVGSTVRVLNYACDVANGKEGDTWDTAKMNPITRSGIADFVDSQANNSRPLSIVTYAGGNVYLGRKKDQFYYTPSFGRLGAPQGINYHGVNSFLWWGWVDRYWNDAIIPDSDGKYVIAVTLYGGSINPKTALLPVSVVGNIVTLDTTAIYANAALPATNYKAVLQRGKIKGVNISYEGNGYAYCIARSDDGGVTFHMIMVWQDVRSFFDADGNRFSVYKIITRAQGRIPDAETPMFKPSK